MAGRGVSIETRMKGREFLVTITCGKRKETLYRGRSRNAAIEARVDAIKVVYVATGRRAAFEAYSNTYECVCFKDSKGRLF